MDDSYANQPTSEVLKLAATLITDQKKQYRWMTLIPHLSTLDPNERAELRAIVAELKAKSAHPVVLEAAKRLP